MRARRWIGVLSGLLWIGSWRIIYLEIFRWQHLTRTLRFNPPPSPPGWPPAKAGLPLKAACVTAVVAPLVFLATVVSRRPEPTALS